jgi:hypothetical protein
LNAYLLDVLTNEADTPTMDEFLDSIESARPRAGLTSDEAVAAVRCSQMTQRG